MAARAWITGVVALFAVWIIMSLLGQFTGFIVGVREYVFASLEERGILIPQEWKDAVRRADDLSLGAWAWGPVIVLGAIIVYIIIESMRRRPEEGIYF